MGNGGTRVIFLFVGRWPPSEICSSSERDGAYKCRTRGDAEAEATGLVFHCPQMLWLWPYTHALIRLHTTQRHFFLHSLLSFPPIQPLSSSPHYALNLAIFTSVRGCVLSATASASVCFSFFWLFLTSLLLTYLSVREFLLGIFNCFETNDAILYCTLIINIVKLSYLFCSCNGTYGESQT